MTNRFHRSALGPLLAAVLAAPWAQAGTGDPALPGGAQSWYYAIGGADPVSIQNPNGASTVIGAHAALNMNYSCGNFDVVASVKDAFSGVVGGLKNKIMTTAKGAIAALPLYTFQRALPGLYEMFQSYTADFKLNFDTAEKSCEDFEQAILAGQDPYADLLKQAKSLAWKKEMVGTKDAVAAKKNVEKTGGNLGVPFPQVAQGKTTFAGGAGQPPIQVIRDTTEAGWNVMLGRAPADNSAYTPPPGVNMRMATLFPKPQDAGKYAVDVLGDVEMRTCDGCTTRTGRPGNGLGPKYEQHRKAVAADLAAVIGAKGTPAAADLKKISAPGVAITGRVVEALRDLPPDERAIMAGRLASEVAMARTIEEALAIRRMLLAGKRIPEVVAQKSTKDEVTDAADEMEREIERFLFEQRVSKEIASNTPSILLERQAQREAQAQRTGRQGRPADTHIDTNGRFQ